MTAQPSIKLCFSVLDVSQPKKTKLVLFFVFFFSTFSIVCHLLYLNNIVLYILYYTWENELSMRALIVWILI